MEAEPIGEGDTIEKVRSRLGFEVPEPVVRRALSESGFDADAAVKFLIDNPGFLAPPVTVVRAVTSTGSRVLAPIMEEEMDDDSQSFDGMNLKRKVKEEVVELGFENQKPAKAEAGSDGSHVPLPFKEVKEEGNVESEKHDSVKKETSSDDSIAAQSVDGLNMKKEVNVESENQDSVKKESASEDSVVKPPLEGLNLKKEVKEEVNVESDSSSRKRKLWEEFLKATGTKVMTTDEYQNSNVKQEPSIQAEEPKKVKLELKPSRVKKEKTEDKVLNVDDGDFPEDPNWFLVGRKIVTALSTTKGRKLVDNEIVHFNFPSPAARYNSQWIVRISTQRSGEVGRLPMEWAKLVIPLVRSSKVIVKGRCIAVPPVLHMMQEITLYVSFYIHHTVFTSEVNTSWRLDASTYINPHVYPLPTLFNLLEMKPYQNADFTPEELNSRKHLLSLRGNSDEAESALPVLKRRKGCPPDQDNDELAVSQSSLTKLVGAAEVFDLEELDPPSTLMCLLKPYQKQALYWMSELEKGTDVENAASTIHPCWAAYCINDERVSSIYVNNFTGEATTQPPPAAQMARGGILADAMGLGKTVMTIALILARQGRGDNTGLTRKMKLDSHTNPSSKADGGTLIVCPMALLGQWKDELETHSEPGSISISVHYGGDRTNDTRLLSGHDVVLITYGVLATAYKSNGENSIYHRVNWHRVVLDEAHTIKAYRTYAAQAAFTLSSHCRWCLTGTPLQNSLEDLFSLLCFLHVEPWCNYAWFNQLIQRPYENGDPRGLKLVKAVLRPLMLRRTKETKDKYGSPILVLPPTDIQLVVCEQSDAESVFYNALLRKSKAQFDEYVAQGKVLHNYANILELLLRLRQCCNHPFLVTSRTDSKKKPVDLDKLSRRFLEFNSKNHTIPSRAYIEQVIENIRKGEKVECPICMESADDPVFTPCAHRMCRECLLSSWSTPMSGPCPLCRQMLNRSDLINCPFENQFMVADVEKDWKESSKVSKLLDFLKVIQQYRTGEKSIVFSQWAAFLDLLEIALKKQGIGYLRFDGSLAQKQREKILREFNETSEKRVLLMSLKAGGVGLNLSAASNVFIMDPWWNPAVEEQAIMRIHRIGQKRRVIVRRFIVKDTVEERLQQVQAKKQRMISGALTDEEVRSARIEDLKRLFT